MISQICHDCAISKGWTPVTMLDRETGEQIPRPVGVWEGLCDVCGEKKWLSAPRDYVRPEARFVTLEEIAELLSGDSLPPSGEEFEKDAPMERLMRYEILVRVSVPLSFDVDDITPDENPGLLREIIAENAMDYISFQDPEEFAAGITEIKLVEDSAAKWVAATYVTIWDGGIKLTSPCQYDPETRVVSEISSKYDINVENLEDEYVELEDGTELREADGVSFIY